MIVDDTDLQKIINFLDLDKITTIEKLDILCYPKKIDKQFHEKFELVKQEIKKISQFIDIKIVREGEIENDNTISK